MGKIIRAGVLVLSICASALLARAQVKQSSADSSTVIRATTRLVQVDVVVTDSSGRPVKDHLSEKDFTILEDGKPQKVSCFSLRCTYMYYSVNIWNEKSSMAFRVKNAIYIFNRIQDTTPFGSRTYSF